MRKDGETELPATNSGGAPDMRIPMKIVTRMVWVIERVSIWSGNTASWACVILIGTICYEVLVRYAFNKPTTWSLELGTFLFAAIWLFSGAWTHQYGSHVKVDLFYTRLSTRGKAILDLCTSPFVIAMMVVLVIQLFDYGLLSMKLRELSPSQWGPPIWIVKMALPVGASMLALQCVAKIIRDFHTVITGRTLNARS